MVTNVVIYIRCTCSYPREDTNGLKQPNLPPDPQSGADWTNVNDQQHFIIRTHEIAIIILI